MFGEHKRINTECDKCGYVRKDYNNVYGTKCIKCGNFIKPLKKADLINEYENIREKYRNEFLKKFKEK